VKERTGSLTDGMTRHAAMIAEPRWTAGVPRARAD
jgi:hypothetical protein